MYQPLGKINKLLVSQKPCNNTKKLYNFPLLSFHKFPLTNYTHHALLPLIPVTKNHLPGLTLPQKLCPNRLQRHPNELNQLIIRLPL
jgi:hypothetical protein